jgi:hypothetical protein
MVVFLDTPKCIIKFFYRKKQAMGLKLNKKKLFGCQMEEKRERLKVTQSNNGQTLQY